MRFDRRRKRRSNERTGSMRENRRRYLSIRNTISGLGKLLDRTKRPVGESSPSITAFPPLQGKTGRTGAQALSLSLSLLLCFSLSHRKALSPVCDSHRLLPIVFLFLLLSILFFFLPKRVASSKVPSSGATFRVCYTSTFDRSTMESTCPALGPCPYSQLILLSCSLFFFPFLFFTFLSQHRLDRVHL